MRKMMLLFALVLGSIIVQAEPLWMRYPRISPDGKEIAFTYKGDIYKVSADGGTAFRLTTHSAYDAQPIWSPDGKQIAFTSDRFGNPDIFIIPITGGTAKRITTNSVSEKPWCFTPDGQKIVFSASMGDPASSALFPSGSLSELYEVSVGGGRPEQLLATPAESVCFTKSGDSFLYMDKKGGENEWRKHHTSSITRDILLYDMKTGKHRFLIQWEGEDRDPVFAPDEKSVYFLSERGGNFNIYSFPLDNPKEVKQITTFPTHPVRFLSTSANGKLCFGYDGEIYTLTPGATPQKLVVEIIADQNADNLETLSFRNGAKEAVVSPDGKQIAFTVRGEVFVTSVDYSTTKQISKTAEQEGGLTFSPDNRTLAYGSERNGNWNIYQAKIARDEDPNFPNATLIQEEAIFEPSATERFAPQYSPDGKELAFIEDRERLMVMDLKTRKVRQITDGSKQYNTTGWIDYSWSPDGKWFSILFTGNKHDPYSDVGIVSTDGKGDIINITNSGYSDENARWVLDGNAILFGSERYGMRNHASWGSLNDVMVVFLNQDAYDKFRLSKEDYELLKELESKADKKSNETADKKDKKDGKDKKETVESKKDIVIELKGIEDRIIRLTPNSSDLGDAIINKEGTKLYYLSAFEGKYDLWVMDLRDGSTKILHKLNSGWASLTMDKEGKNLFLLGSSNMQKIGLPGDALKSISFNAEMVLDKEAERAYMFDRVYRQELKRFYTTEMHGVDWPMMRKTYEKFLPHVNNNYDFADILSEILGELNVSHTGGRYFPSAEGDVTADLGLLFNWSYAENGLLIDEILEKGPFDKMRTKVQAGDVLEKIDGVEITAGADYFPMLNKKRNKKTLVSFYRPANGERWDEVVTPISTSVKNKLLYNRWVKQRAADVERLSGGRLGYVHIESMGDPSFRSVYSDILGKYNNCDGIVIDTRFNGGGRLHEDIEVLFSGEKYFTQVVRGKESCDMPSRRWNKASIMLTCEANYSNAHGTPWVYRHQGIGKLVGMPVPGTMTSVSWETLQDPTLVFGIPIIGYRLPDGSYLENAQLEPDYKVMNAPEVIVTGRDEQLEKAVEVLLQEIDAKSKR